jgi:phosphate transport system permease protein
MAPGHELGLPKGSPGRGFALKLERVADVERDVVDLVAEGAVEVPTVFGRAKALARFKFGDRFFHGLTFTAAIAVLILLGGVIVSLVIGSLPAIQEFGFGFLVTEVWNPVTDKYGAGAAIFGTIFLSELCPQPLRQPIGIAIELLAGIPSIIFGIWGLFIFAPILQAYVEPGIIAFFGPIPGVNMLFAGPPYGIGIFTAGFILAIMVLPFISSISRDVFATVPPVLKESAYGLGFTTREVVGKVVIPYTRVGIIGGIMLALGRALGETMAVTFVIGNAHRISTSVLAPGTTISATIANEFTEAVGSLYTSALIELGLILFVITFFVLAIARYLLMRIEKKGAR